MVDEQLVRDATNQHIQTKKVRTMVVNADQRLQAFIDAMTPAEFEAFKLATVEK